MGIDAASGAPLCPATERKGGSADRDISGYATGRTQWSRNSLDSGLWPAWQHKCQPDLLCAYHPDCLTQTPERHTDSVLAWACLELHHCGHSQ